MIFVGLPSKKKHFAQTHQVVVAILKPRLGNLDVFQISRKKTCLQFWQIPTSTFWLKLMVDVGKYSSPMEHLGIVNTGMFFLTNQPTID